MNPTLPEILIGQAAAIAAPQPPEAGGDYMVARLGMISMLAVLAAQEAERGPQARTWENQAMRELFERSRADYDAPLGGALATALASPRAGGEWSALDADNAALRRVLIALHEAVEGRADAALNLEILRLYRQMAHVRRLDLPSALQ